MNLYVLELLFAGLQVRAAVNGIELVTDLAAGSKTIGYRINAYVVEGANTLTIALRLPPPATSAPAPPSPDFSARLLRGVLGRDPGAAGVMLAYEWEPAKAPVTQASWQVVLNETWAAPVSFGRWTWQDAPAGVLTAADNAAILAELRALHAALGSRDAQALLAAHRLKFGELARAMGATEAEFLRELADSLTAMFGAPNFRLAPLDLSRVLVEPLAGGRLARARMPDGSAPIQASGGEETFHLLPVFTRVAGRWMMAR